MNINKTMKDYWDKEGGCFEGYYDEPKNIFASFINNFLKKRMSIVTPMLNIETGNEVLDLGCGTGRLLLGVSKMGAKVTGLDYSYRLLALAKERFQTAGIGKYKLILADASSIPIKDRYYDHVICIGLLDYVLDIRSIINEINRVLKDQGIAVVTIPKKFTPFLIFRSRFGGYIRKALFGLPPILTAVTKTQLLKILDEAGFRVHSIAEFYRTLYIVSISHK